ncbi:conserved hypothetical protein [Carnobacterium maltaromaticum]|uniref:hypothetical protein n=1 Tax=Carnobacterium maltaromaticum TaxID=2751 RepID=UPI00070494BC|nr:hypothetical protein [Carnobacterium maltaromaticum]KRN70590.1 hypothetical protein IV76_GL001700 [Carnobacterium maltaromaticum]CRH17695.1 conserved hypothetical protein [Carnobacterium maltaromaticum]
MTNKLEEVLKELQESHVLVDREEYEHLVEKAKESENEEIKLEVGGYYSDGKRIYKMLKLGAQDNYISSFSFELCCFAKNISCGINGNFFKGLRKATDEEIKLFKRAEMYHKHGRKLDELKSGDFVHYVNENSERTSSPRMPYDNVPAWIETIQRGEGAIYLTAEEHHEAHKKIVGE